MQMMFDMSLKFCKTVYLLQNARFHAFKSESQYFIAIFMYAENTKMKVPYLLPLLLENKDKVYEIVRIKLIIHRAALQ